MHKIISLLFAFWLACPAQAQGNLYISPGATLYTTGNSTITVQNARLTNDGSLTANDGTVLFKGNGTNVQSSINGTGTTAFRNVTIDKTANDVQLNQNVSVSGNLTLVSGGLELAAGNVDFGTTGSLQSETATNRVSGTGGYLQATATLNAPANVNLANLGAMMSSTQNLGSTQIRRSQDIAGSSIARQYVITPTNNSGLNATLRFHYFDAELNGNDENTMMLWRSTDAGLSWVELENSTTRDAAANWVQRTGIDAFSSWTAANPGALPVELLSFTGTNKGHYILLAWQTASEQNNVGFEVERSSNAAEFEKIDFVSSTGITNGVQSYRLEDKQPLEGINYYRLKQIDYDGGFAYSTIVEVTQDDKNGVGVFPNPGNGVFTITGLGSATQKHFILMNSIGQAVPISVQENRQFDISSYPSGVYFLRVSNNKNGIKIVKE